LEIQEKKEVHFNKISTKLNRHGGNFIHHAYFYKKAED